MTNLLIQPINETLLAASKKDLDSDLLSTFTGSDIPAFALPEAVDPIQLACELSELARILGGEFTPRPPNTEHRIFLL